MALKMTILAFCLFVCFHRETALEVHKVTSIRLIGSQLWNSPTISQLIYSHLQGAPRLHVLRAAPSTLKLLVGTEASVSDSPSAGASPVMDM